MGEKVWASSPSPHFLPFAPDVPCQLSYTMYVKYNRQIHSTNTKHKYNQQILYTDTIANTKQKHKHFLPFAPDVPCQLSYTQCCTNTHKCNTQILAKWITQIFWELHFLTLLESWRSKVLQFCFFLLGKFLVSMEFQYVQKLNSSRNMKN